MRGLIRLTLWPLKAALYLMAFFCIGLISFLRALLFKSNDF